MAKKSIFEKLNAVFNKEELSKEDFGRDGFMLLRFLSMKEEYTTRDSYISFHNLHGNVS
jgi:hypothetical protein